ncbi:MAG TPA: class I SAM-dependent methyltransferase [Acidimicrobiales bacterium]
MTPPTATSTATDTAAPLSVVPPAETGSAFDHGAISRFNAWFFTAFARYLNHVARHHKSAAFADLRGDAVLEVGAGTGANLGYLPPGTHLYAVEPSLRMHGRLRRRCAAAGIEVTILATGAESIPLPDGSMDEVICSLVLCTVPDPERALAEIRRVLRPGGTFRFVEHVAAPPGRLRGRVQRAIRRPWGWLFEGCDPHRHTAETVERAGFAAVRHERRKLRHSVFWPANTAAWGVATR